MIDSHSHTSYSKHANGSVDELVRASIAAGVKVLTITDHAPFPVDSENRLRNFELDHYFFDIQQAQLRYQNQIKVLSGLEFDYMPGTEDYSRELMSRYDLDFAIGSIHYVEVPGYKMVKVWELERLNHRDFLDLYFASLEGMLESGLFDALGHVDTLLRGVSEEVILGYLEPLLPLFVRNNIAYELNASGMRKSSLDPQTGCKMHGIWSYPSRILLPQLMAHDIALTVGSDAHDPNDAGAGIRKLILHVLKPQGLQNISYYERRQKVEVTLDSLVTMGMRARNE